MSNARQLPQHRHPFGAGQTQRRALRNSRARLELDPLDEQPTCRRDPRPIAEILAEPVPALPVRHHDGLTMQIRRQSQSAPVIMLYVCIGVMIGMIAMLAMLRV